MIEKYGRKHPKPVNPRVSYLITDYMAHIGKCHRPILDIANGELPFPDNSTSGIIDIHYYNAALVDEMIRVLEPGGFFCFETIDGRISHELGLPEYGFLKYKLNNFKFIYYKEDLVKGTSSGASVCKIVAVKNKSKKTTNVYKV